MVASTQKSGRCRAGYGCRGVTCVRLVGKQNLADSVTDWVSTSNRRDPRAGGYPNPESQESARFPHLTAKSPQTQTRRFMLSPRCAVHAPVAARAISVFPPSALTATRATAAGLRGVVDRRHVSSTHSSPKETLPVLTGAIATSHRVEAALEEGAIGAHYQRISRSCAPKAASTASDSFRTRQSELRKDHCDWMYVGVSVREGAATGRRSSTWRWCFRGASCRHLQHRPVGRAQGRIRSRRLRAKDMDRPMVDEPTSTSSPIEREALDLEGSAPRRSSQPLA